MRTGPQAGACLTFMSSQPPHSFHVPGGLSRSVLFEGEHFLPPIEITVSYCTVLTELSYSTYIDVYWYYCKPRIITSSSLYSAQAVSKSSSASCSLFPCSKSVTLVYSTNDYGLQHFLKNTALALGQILTLCLLKGYTEFWLCHFLS